MNNLMLALLMLAAATVADRTFENSEVKCELGDTNGQLKLAFAAAKGKAMQCVLNWTRLMEQSTTSSTFNNILSESSDDGLLFAWKNAATGPYTFEGEHVFQYLSQHRVLEVKAYVGSEDKDIEVWPGHTQHAYKNQLKFTFRLRANNSGENWVSGFSQQEGEMCISMTLGCHASEAEARQERTQLSAGTPIALQGPPDATPVTVGQRAKMHSSGSVCVNGTQQVMNQSRIQYRQRSQNFYTFNWCFPHFETELIYDPTIELISDDPTDNTLLIVGLSVGGAALVGVVVLGVVCFRKRAAARKHVTTASV
jgi:hypothetical protein